MGGESENPQNANYLCSLNNYYCGGRAAVLYFDV
jgi:hypothetical protein